MRKFIFFVIMTFIILLSMPNQGISKGEASDDQDYQVIPDDAIRLRILANSDDKSDQDIKHDVRDAVNEQITEWVEELTDIDTARTMIENRLPEIRQTVEQVLTEAGSDQDYEVSYGKNVSFPVKLYGNYLYPAGKYEAVLISLGEGEGSNWWCVLFPPLCFLDFSNGTTAEDPEDEDHTEKTDDEAEMAAKETEENEAEIKFFLFEWLGLS